MITEIELEAAMSLTTENFIPGVLGTDAPNMLVSSAPLASVVMEDRASTVADHVKQFEYAIALMQALNGPDFYYDPLSKSKFSAYVSTRLDENPEEMLGGLLMLTGAIRKRVTGDVLSDVANTLVSKVSARPTGSVDAVARNLILDSDPLVVDSVLRAIDDHDALWLKRSAKVREAVRKIPWKDLREEAEDQLGIDEVR